MSKMSRGVTVSLAGRFILCKLPLDSRPTIIELKHGRYRNSKILHNGSGNLLSYCVRKFVGFGFNVNVLKDFASGSFPSPANAYD